MENNETGGAGNVTPTVFILVIASAFIHASWNLATRAIKGDLAVLACKCFFTTILLCPVLFFLDYTGNDIILGLVYAFVSGIVHIIYLTVLGLMYAHASGNISVVYPVARGTGVSLTAILAGSLLSETISLIGFFGILSILSGIAFMALSKVLLEKMTQGSNSSNTGVVQYIEDDVESAEKATENETIGKHSGAKALFSGVHEATLTKQTEVDIGIDENDGMKSELSPGRGQVCDVLNNKKFGGIILALILGCIICCYSIVDKRGVGHLNPVAYLWVMSLTETLFFVPYFLLVEKNRIQLIDACRKRKKYIFIVTLFAGGCYLTILYALTLTKASYITALRECSVAFGALLGVFVLKEKFHCLMIIGIAFIVNGMVMIKIS